MACVRGKAFPLASACFAVFGTPSSPRGFTPNTPSVPSRAARDSARRCGSPPVSRAPERVAQPLRAVRWPGRKFLPRVEVEAGPLHAPATCSALAHSRSALALRFVAPLWRAPLAQSAKGRLLTEIRGIFTLRVQTPLSPPPRDRRCARTRPPLHRGLLAVVLCKVDRVSIAGDSRAGVWRKFSARQCQPDPHALSSPSFT